MGETAGSLATMNALEGPDCVDTPNWNGRSLRRPRNLNRGSVRERSGWVRTGSWSTTGQSKISVQDFAVAMINELENPRHVRERFTAGY